MGGHGRQDDIDYQSTNASSGTNTPRSVSGGQTSEAQIIQFIKNLKEPEKRAEALVELSKNREEFAGLAPILWYSVGTIAALLQEIVAVYPYLMPPQLDVPTSNRVCNVLALLQCVASHHETRSLFLNAHIPLFLYPFLNSSSKSKPFEYLRLTSLGVIGALVKVDDSSVIKFLLETEIVPLCLRIMDRGSELSKTVATFIVQKILVDDYGLEYICEKRERFYAVCQVLNTLTKTIMQTPSSRLLKHLMRCYLRLSDNPNARMFLKQHLPSELRDLSESEVMDDSTKRWLNNLMMNLTQ